MTKRIIKSNKENTTKALGNSPPQLKPPQQTVGISDNRPDVQMHRKLQLKADSSSVIHIPPPLFLGAQALDTAQRKIKVKGGPIYEDNEKVGNLKRTKDLVGAAGMYLLNSTDDFAKIKLGQEADLLAPKRHLIGERHNQSEFTKAAAKWSWGANLLVESYSQHAKIADPTQAEKQQGTVNSGDDIQEIINVEAKALEDTAAKSLSNLANAKIYGGKLLAFAREFQKTPDLYALSMKKPVFSTKWPKNLELFWQKHNSAFKVSLMLAQYLAASTKRRGLGIIGRYFKCHELVRDNVTEQMITDMGAGCDNIKEQLDDTTTNHLVVAKLSTFETHVDTLIDVMKQFVRAYDREGFNQLEIDTMTHEAIAQQDISKLSPLRERYMKQNIQSADVPALVKIGKRHVTNLASSMPPQSEGYNSYTEFDTKNKYSKVDII